MKRTLRLLLAAGIFAVLMIALATFASAADLTTDIGTVESETGLYLREKPSTKAEILATAAEGDYVMIIRKVGDWYLVNFNQQVGYMHGDYLDFAEYGHVTLGTGSVASLVVNIRQEPTTESELVGQIFSGVSVDIIGFEDGWYKVSCGYATGYVRSDLITMMERPLGTSGMNTAVLAGNVDPKAEIAAAQAAAYARKNSSSSGSSSSSSGSSSSSSGSSSSDRGQKIATYALNYLGCPYVYGGTSTSGFDCSGFTQFIYRQFGISINRTATAQLSNGYSVSYSELRPGDLVFFGYGSSAFHVGIYIGNGQFVHAENYGTGVCITNLSDSYYANSYLCARRIVG